jgi:NADH:ubiquinone oxidoreductase subunit 5 (subunit L)/multisubunit Na+/H+ antiporter MnhA subunit
VNRDVQIKFWISTLLMFTLPILTYFMFHDYILDGYILQLTPGQRLTWSAVSAVIMANILAIGYVVMALTTEEDKPRGPNHEKELAALSKHLREQYGHEDEGDNKKTQ